MPLPLSVAKPRTLAVAPPVAAAGALAVGAGLLWLHERLARRNFQGSVWSNDYQQDALFRRPNYRGMTSGQIQRSRQLLDAVGEDAYMLQPGGVYLERRELDRELLRRAGGGGFIFIGPGLSGEPDLTGWTAGAAAAALGVAGDLWSVSVVAGQGIGRLLSQIWGLFNRPPQLVPATWPETTTPQTYNLSAPSFVRVETWRRADATIYWADTNQIAAGLGENRPGTTFEYADVVGFTITPYADVSGTYPPAERTVFPACTIVVRRASGIVTVSLPSNITDKVQSPPYRGLVGVGWLQAYPTSLKINGADAPGPTVSAQVPAPGRAPFTTVLAAAPAPLPAYTPPAAEPRAVPAADPVTQPAPAPGVTPATVPALAPITAPSLPRVPAVPGATPTTGAGTVPAPSPPPTPTTPQDSVLPWPGASPTPADAKAPPATLPGIARKTGEIEDKLDQIGKMLQPPKDGPDFGDLLGLVPTLLNWLVSADPAGSYEISSPCEQGPGSPAEPLVAGWGASIGPDALVLKRLDALAGLLQHHKNLKQPSCKNPSPVGEVVTVQFEET